uniref:Uncharacterized protein n=1 Tax=Kalanchoe fedtschenkoi TaxID=63787 RepID=A0A7N0UYV0_KALFE
MFEAFQLPHFGLSKEALPHPQIWRRHFLQKYLELKSMKPGDCLSNQILQTESQMNACMKKTYEALVKKLSFRPVVKTLRCILLREELAIFFAD